MKLDLISFRKIKSYTLTCERQNNKIFRCKYNDVVTLVDKDFEKGHKKH